MWEKSHRITTKRMREGVLLDSAGRPGIGEHDEELAEPVWVGGTARTLTSGTVSDTIACVTIEEALPELEGHKKQVRFSRLLVICENFFGKARIVGSHHIFKTPWPGDPRINLQEEKGMAKPYQVRQVLRCLRKLKETE
jgi:hypothetical protein